MKGILTIGAIVIAGLLQALPAAAQGNINTDMTAFRAENLAIATRTDKQMKMTYRVVKMKDGTMMALVPLGDYEKLLKKTMGPQSSGTH